MDTAVQIAMAICVTIIILSLIGSKSGNGK